MLTSLTQAQKVVLAVAIGALILGALLIVLGGDRNDSEQAAASYEPPPPEPVEIRVHVTGEVANPGVYELPLGARVEDAVNAAGGFKPGARESSVNLAAFVEDGEQIFVEAEPPAEEPAALTADEPSEERPTAAPARSTTAAGRTVTDAPGSEAPVTPARPRRVRLNSAGLEELQRLPGVGPETAKSILYYRHEHGKFRSFEELANVKGIGPKTIEKIRPAATLN